MTTVFTRGKMPAPIFYKEVIWTGESKAPYQRQIMDSMIRKG